MGEASNLQLQRPNKISTALCIYTHAPSEGNDQSKGEEEQEQREESGQFEGFLILFAADSRSVEEMAPVKSMERTSSFAMACSLLSRYVKQNGAAAGELSLGIKAETEEQKTPATMNLLPGSGADTENGEEGKETMELFPQKAGFGAEYARQQEKRQLTIFYGGKVLVFNDFPAEKAKDLMQMASKGAAAVQNSGVLPSSTTATVTDSTKVSAMPAPSNDVVGAQKNAADIPQAPKASLRRFLEKRKDRLQTKAPYQASPSDAAPVKKEMPEGQPWLGLGPQSTSPDLSLRPEGNQ